MSVGSCYLSSCKACTRLLRWHTPLPSSAPHPQDIAVPLSSALPTLSPADLVDLVVGLAELGAFPGEAWMDAHEAAANAHASELSARQFGLIKAAYGQLEATLLGGSIGGNSGGAGGPPAGGDQAAGQAWGAGAASPVVTPRALRQGALA
jgi:hypothetical protein